MTARRLAPLVAVLLLVATAVAIFLVRRGDADPAGSGSEPNQRQVQRAQEALANWDSSPTEQLTWDPYDPPPVLAVDFAQLAADQRTLTVRFTGSPGPRGVSCGADYHAHFVESARAVAVIVVTDPNPRELDCPAIGAERTATARLASPLGTRAVLEIQQGRRVPVR